MRWRIRLFDNRESPNILISFDRIIEIAFTRKEYELLSLLLHILGMLTASLCLFQLCEDSLKLVLCRTKFLPGLIKIFPFLFAVHLGGKKHVKHE